MYVLMNDNSNNNTSSNSNDNSSNDSSDRRFKIHQRGVQWKQGVVICMVLYTSFLYNTTPIHCNPLPLHPPLRNAETSTAIFHTKNCQTKNL